MSEPPEDEAAPDTPRADESEPTITARRHADDELDAATPPDGISIGMDAPTEPAIVAARAVPLDLEVTLNLTGDGLDIPLRDDMRVDPPAEEPASIGEISREHLKGLLEALIFASDKPIRAADLAKSASAPLKDVKLLLAILKNDYSTRGVQLDEVAGGWIFRTNAAYAPFVRDLTKQKPVKLTRAQIETLAILAYRQPITRPEIDEIRGVDSGPVLKLLLDRDLVKILGKKDEPGRPLLYGTTAQFLEFFGLKSLKELPTLREFTELNEDSRRVVERELGDVLGGAVQTADDAGTEEGPVTHRVDPDARDIRASIPPAASPSDPGEGGDEPSDSRDEFDEITELHAEPRHDDADAPADDAPLEEPSFEEVRDEPLASGVVDSAVDTADEPPPTHIEPDADAYGAAGPIPQSSSEPPATATWDRDDADRSRES